MTKRKNEARWIESRQRWQINVQHDGERRTFSSPTVGTKGKVEAEKAADKWLETGEKIANIRFDALWKDFMAEVELTTSTGNYRKHEQMGRLWLMPRVKNKRMVSITLQDWQDCINVAYKEGLSKKSCQNIRASITYLYRYAKKRRIPMEKPEDLTVPKDAPVMERNILQPADLKKLFAIDYIIRYKKHEPCFFIHAWRFLVLSGLRRGELCGLKKADIVDNVLYIKRSVNQYEEETGGKNENARRYFVLNDMEREVLADQERTLKTAGIISPWLFPDEQGDRLDPNHLYKKWYTYREQHGIECSLHEMRHTLISVAKADVPEELLKRVVGHSQSMDTFGIYGHDVDGEMNRVADILDDIFNKLLE